MKMKQPIEYFGVLCGERVAPLEKGQVREHPYCVLKLARELENVARGLRTAKRCKFAAADAANELTQIVNELRARINSFAEQVENGRMLCVVANGGAV